MKNLIAIQKITKTENGTANFEMSFGYTLGMGAVGKFLGNTAVKSQLVKLGSGAGQSLEYYIQNNKTKKLPHNQVGKKIKKST
jgi:hypothetical protein